MADEAAVQLRRQGCLRRARDMTFENAWNELDLAVWVDYNERFNQADADDAALARAEAMAEAREQPKAKAKSKAKAKVQPKAKAMAMPQAHPQQSARPHADALARALAQEMPNRFFLVPGSSLNPSPAMGLNSSSSSAGGMGF